MTVGGVGFEDRLQLKLAVALVHQQVQALPGIGYQHHDVQQSIAVEVVGPRLHGPWQRQQHMLLVSPFYQGFKPGDAAENGSEAADNEVRAPVAIEVRDFQVRHAEKPVEEYLGCGVGDAVIDKPQGAEMSRAGVGFPLGQQIAD